MRTVQPPPLRRRKPRPYFTCYERDLFSTIRIGRVAAHQPGDGWHDLDAPKGGAGAAGGCRLRTMAPPDALGPRTAPAGWSTSRPVTVKDDRGAKHVLDARDVEFLNCPLV